jgi:ADP-ribosylglycohydrolase
MRVAPLGAFFADASIERVCEQARLSAEVTHCHPEGIAGAIAVAVATVLAWRKRAEEGPLGPAGIEEVRNAVPRGYTRDAIDEALGVSASATVTDAAQVLGNGSGVTAPDTVPLCLWIAARNSGDFAASLWDTVSALGDRDTTCAIVGGILALKTGIHGIPAEWLQAREALPLEAPGRD